MTSRYRFPDARTNVSELSRFVIIPNGLALVSRSCENSGEASIPRSDLPRTSDAAGVLAGSSPKLQVDTRMPFLEGNIIGVTSALLTSIGALGQNLCAVTVQQIGPNLRNKSPVCDGEEVGQCEGNSREDEFGVLCEGDVSGGSISVRNMACARESESWRENAQKEHCKATL